MSEDWMNYVRAKLQLAEIQLKAEIDDMRDRLIILQEQGIKPRLKIDIDMLCKIKPEYAQRRRHIIDAQYNLDIAYGDIFHTINESPQEPALHSDQNP